MLLEKKGEKEVHWHWSISRRCHDIHPGLKEGKRESKASSPVVLLERVVGLLPVGAEHPWVLPAHGGLRPAALLSTARLSRQWGVEDQCEATGSCQDTGARAIWAPCLPVSYSCGPVDC